MLAVSKLSFMACFVKPSRSLLRAETWALQKILRGPWNSIPANALKSLKTLGLPVEARSVSELCSASQVRCANLTSTVFSHLLLEHRRFVRVENNILALAGSESHARTSFVRLWEDSTNAYNTSLADPIRPINPKVYEQRRVYNAILADRPPFDFQALIIRKLEKFLTLDSPHSTAEHILEVYRNVAAPAGPRFLFTHFKTINNHWCSQSRFGKPRKACYYCGILGPEHNDRVPHSLSCDRFRTLFCEVHNNCPDFFSLDIVLTFQLGGANLSSQVARYCLYYILINFRVYNTCRYGHPFSKRILVSAIKSVVKTSRAALQIRQKLISHESF